MTIRHEPACTLELTAKEWELTLTALRAYQHHTLYRALHEKIAPFSGAQDVSLLVASIAPPARHPGTGRTRLPYAC